MQKDCANIYKLARWMAKLDIMTAVKKLEKRLRRLQCSVSRKYEKNKKGKEYVKTSNIIKLEKKIQLLHKVLATESKCKK